MSAATETAMTPTTGPVHLRPGFDAAMRHSTHAPLALLDRDPGFYRCIGDIPTYALGVLALYLHSTDRLYHRGLQEAARDLFSAGRASAILARMQSAGLIVPADAFQRGRQRRYVPAPAMVQAFRACYRIELESLALIDPRVVPMVAAYDRSDVFDRIVAFLAGRHLAAPALDQELIDPLGGVGRRSMGLMCAYALAEAAFADGRTSPEGPVAVNTSALARRLGVSRTHVRRVLATLKDAGLIAGGPSSDRLVLTPAFAEGYTLYFYGMFSVLLAAVGCMET